MDGAPRIALGCWPTPVADLDLRSVVPAFSGRAWVKREDLSGRDLGGGKVRKLEFLLADARQRRFRTVLTVGGVGSNHCLATAYYAADAGLESHLVLYPHHATAGSRRTLRAITALGPGLTPARSANATVPVVASRLARLRAAGRRPYLIPPGGCTATGGLGAVDLALEIAAQVARGELDVPDAVVIAFGSGTTAAGLSVGFALSGLPTEVLAVRVYDPPAASSPWVRWLARRIARRAGLRGAGARVRVLKGYLGRGYAEPTPASVAARQVAAGLGLTLDPTYTAKAFAALLDVAARPPYRDRRLLFLQTYDARIPDGLLDDPVPNVPEPLRSYL